MHFLFLRDGNIFCDLPCEQSLGWFFHSFCKTLTVSQNPRIFQVGKELSDHPVQPVLITQPRSMSCHALDTPRDGHSSTSLGSPFQHLTAHSRKKFFLKESVEQVLNVQSSSRKPFTNFLCYDRVFVRILVPTVSL